MKKYCATPPMVANEQDGVVAVSLCQAPYYHQPCQAAFRMGGVN